MDKCPTLDLQRLAQDTAAVPRARSQTRAPGGRDTTGLMQAVRDNLDALLALHSGGLTWDAVAAALGAQGFVTGDGRAITGRNLTGVISSVRRQAANRATAEAARANRSDLPSRASVVTSQKPSMRSLSRLSSQLHGRRNIPPPATDGSSEDNPLTEAEIRHIQVEKHRHLFKKV